MRATPLAALLLVACSTTTVTATAGSPSAASNDAHICDYALSPPWNTGAIEALTREPQTPIELKAAEVNRRFATEPVASNGGVDAWHELNAMCVDAGYG